MRIAGWLLLLAGPAWAYPHFQLSTGAARCNQCHFAPAGGGLLNQYGRDESADTVSLGGNGDFLHGAVSLPDWLTLGGDLRLAGLVNDTGAGEGAELAAFPMQVELGARLAWGAWSLTGSLGLRGVARTPASQAESEASEVDGPSVSSYLVSREHFVSWRPTGTGPYARAGRFFAPFGLRLVDHTAYVRRYLGYNLLEETYGLGGGIVTDGGEVHAVAFLSDPLRGPARREVGGALLAETRLGPTALGLSSRIGTGEGETRLTGGLFGKLWWEAAQILFQAEVDGVRQILDEAKRFQLAAYAGPVWLPARGLYVGAAYELFDEDVVVADVERHAVGAWVALHPWAHVEVMASGRVQIIGTSDRATAAMLQVHYYP